MRGNSNDLGPRRLAATGAQALREPRVAGPTAADRFCRLGSGIVLAACLAALATGCREEAPPAPAPAPTREVTASGPIEQLEAPSQVLLFGGCDDLAGAATELRGMLGPAAAGVDLAGVGPALARQLALSDPSALALDAPLRFALLDPGSNEEPLALLVGTRSREALLAALPAGQRAAAEGAGFVYPGLTKKPIYLSFIDDFALFTRQPLAELRPFFVALAGADLTGRATLVVAVDRALALHGQQLEQRLQQARAAASASGASAPGAGFVHMLDWLATVAGGIDQVVVRLQLTPQGARLALDVRPRSDSELSRFFRSLGPRELQLLAKVPVDAAFALAASIDPDSTSELTRSLTSWLLQLTLGAQPDEGTVTALNAYWKATNGQIAFAVHPTPGLEGLRVSGVVGIRDAAAARAAQATLRASYQLPAVSKAFEQAGVKVRYEPGATRIGGVAVDRVRAELSPEGQAAAEHDLRALGRTASLFAELMNSHAAIDDQLGVTAYGRDGDRVLEAWLGGTMPGGLDRAAGLVQARRAAAPGTFLLAYAQPLTLLREWAIVPGDGAALPNRGVALSAGSSEGVLHLLLDVPAEQASTLTTALAGLDRSPAATP